MAKTYTTAIEVRGYELDSFGHVNHANYLNYLEHARWQMLGAEGITLATFQSWGLFPVIAALDIQYLRPTFMGDSLTIESQLVEYRRSSLQIIQVIKKGDKSVVQAKIRSVIVNTEGRPAALPEEQAASWRERFGAEYRSGKSDA